MSVRSLSDQAARERIATDLDANLVRRGGRRHRQDDRARRARRQPPRHAAGSPSTSWS